MKCNVSPSTFFDYWLAFDGQPFWPYFENIKSWWAVRHLPNVFVLHYAELKRDAAGCLERLAKFLNIPLSDELKAKVLEHSSFAWMKKNAQKVTPLNGAVFADGGAEFVHKGSVICYVI